jgi:glutathione S-transferase
MEKAVSVLYEGLYHPEGQRSEAWLTRCLGQASAGLDELTFRLVRPYACGPDLSHADVMITTMIWYMQDRMPDALSPKAHAPLIALAQHCETLPAFQAARVSDFETMPKA